MKTPLRAAFCLLLPLLAVGPSIAGVTVTFDAETLNDLISSVSVKSIEVPVAGDRTIEVLLDELKVLGFRPASDDAGEGYIQTALTVSAPQLGLRIALQPRLSLNVIRQGSHSLLELRFEEVELPLTLARIDLAPFLPPIRYPADNEFLLAGATGDVEVRSRVAGVSMTEKLIRFEIALEVVPPAP